VIDAVLGVGCAAYSQFAPPIPSSGNSERTLRVFSTSSGGNNSTTFPTGVNGTGQTIGIIELGGGYVISDIQQYFQGLGINTTHGGCYVCGRRSELSRRPETERMVRSELDIQVAGAIAPGARNCCLFHTEYGPGIYRCYYDRPFHDTANSPSVISISWGGPESSWSQSALTALDDACQSAGALGVTITARLW